MPPFPCSKPRASKTDDATRGWRRRTDAQKTGGESAGLQMSKRKDSEPVIQTGAKNGNAKAGARHIWRSREVGLGLQGRIEIFALHRDVVCEGVFDAGADYAAIVPDILRTEVSEAVVERAVH